MESAVGNNRWEAHSPFPRSGGLSKLIIGSTVHSASSRQGLNGSHSSHKALEGGGERVRVSRVSGQ